METVGDLVGILGGIVGMASAYFSWREWQKTNRKIAMLTDAGRAAEVLPAWYTKRMMQDYWLFGLLTTGGQIIAIKRIRSVSDDGAWLDAELATADEVKGIAKGFGTVVHAISDDRTEVSLQISQIVAALELWTS